MSTDRIEELEREIADLRQRLPPVTLWKLEELERAKEEG
jgi:hypothetical protein